MGHLMVSGLSRPWTSVTLIGNIDTLLAMTEGRGKTEETGISLRNSQVNNLL